MTHSQTTDTLCLPIPVAKKVLAAAQQKKLLDSILVIKDSDIKIQQEIIGLQKEQLSAWTEKETVWNGKEATLLLQREAYAEIVKTLERDLKKQRIKTKVTAGLGLAAVIVTGLILK